MVERGGRGTMKRMLGVAMLLSVAAIMPAQEAAAQDPIAGAIVGGAVGGIIGGAVGRGAGGAVATTGGAAAAITVIRTAPGCRYSRAIASERKLRWPAAGRRLSLNAQVLRDRRT